MWLVLVAAGTGYLARCWQKSRKFKTGRGFLKCNAALHASQGSPSCTPRRGRSNIAGRRGLPRRSRSARGLGRKLLHGRKEGKLATTEARDSDENFGSPDTVFDDYLRETSSCMEKPLLLTVEIDAKEQDHFLFSDCVLPIEKGSSNGGVTTRLDLAKRQLEGVASFSSNWLSSAKPTKNASLLSASAGRLAHHWLDILGVKIMGEERRQESLPLKLKKSTEQAFHFFANVARGFTHRRCSKFLTGNPSWKPGFVLSTRDAHLLKFLSCGKPYNGTLAEEKKMEQRCAPYFVNSQHLKALLDSESAKSINAFVTSKSDGWRSQENPLQGFNEASLVAFGVAMGVLLVTTGRSGELEDLHKLLVKNNASIEELKKQIDSRFEMDPLKLPEVEKVPSGLTITNETCSQKAHHPDISSSHSAGEKGSLELFNAHGFDDLEAELEAELRLIELNGCNAIPAGREWKRKHFNQKCWQPEGDEKGYMDKPEGDDDDASYMDIDIHDSIVIQDAGQVYESDFVVPPLELERRLWQVLEQRHEERICELENDLRVTQEKVRAKEMEVEWWKEHAGWHMETSLGGKSECEHPVSLNP